VTDELYDELESALKALKDDKTKAYKAIVELPFTHTKEMALLSIGFLCYFSVDRRAKIIKLENASRNEYYEQAVLDYDFDHTSFVVPFSAAENSMVQAALKNEVITLTNWDKLRRPDVGEGVARLNQATSGIAYSVIAPVGDFGVLGFNFFQPKEALSPEVDDFVARYSALIARALG
jgi:hypothetical protein